VARVVVERPVAHVAVGHLRARLGLGVLEQAVRSESPVMRRKVVEPISDWRNALKMVQAAGRERVLR
jgi:hypothetical protein